MRNLFMKLCYRLIGIKSFEVDFSECVLDEQMHHILKETKHVLCLDTTDVNFKTLSSKCFHRDATRGVCVPFTVFGKKIPIVFCNKDDTSTIIHELTHAYQFVNKGLANSEKEVESEVKRISKEFSYFVNSYYTNRKEIDARMVQYRFEDLNGISNDFRI